MMTPEKRAEYDRMASLVARGRAGYQPARKSRYSKSPTKDFGPAPDFL